jgi:hypothetical protein
MKKQEKQERVFGMTKAAFIRWTRKNFLKDSWYERVMLVEATTDLEKEVQADATKGLNDLIQLTIARVRK